MSEQAESTVFALFEGASTPEATVIFPSPLIPTYEVAVTLPPITSEDATNSHSPIWQPTEPQFAKAIAQHYGVSRKSVQQWFQKVKEACPWFEETDLKLPDQRYTPLCIELMGSYRTSGLVFSAWKSQLWQKVRAWWHSANPLKLHQ